MKLQTVNEDANYIIQMYVDFKWQTVAEEYSISAATNLMTNIYLLTKGTLRVLSKRSNNMLLSEIG